VTQSRRDGTRFRVRFNDLAFIDVLRHATPAGRDVARTARARLERDGAPVGELASCDPAGVRERRKPGHTIDI